ncbi:MAG: tetratricopeptide repeat protein [Gemmatimonadetes bacterium]|nr:tetratricopeptide repeat protein [Gemmatimonadota bacterium]
MEAGEFMARHPTAHRVPRDAPSSDDAFVARVLETSVWAKQNTRRLFIAIFAVLVLVLGISYYRNYTTRLHDRAETELTQIRPTVLSGNAALAVRDLEAFVDRFGSTPAAREARLLLAQAYLETAQPRLAIAQVQDLAAEPSDPMGFAAGLLLGAAHEALAEPDQAAEAYLRLADGARFPFQRAAALDAAARIRFEQGNAAAAVQIYDRILSLIPGNDPDRPIYELRRAEAAARASTAG